MPGFRILAGITCVLALAALGSLWGSPRHIEAAGGDPFGDVDRDMVPDCIELLAQTSTTDADTDGDGIDDFEEILTFTSHDPSLPTASVDHAMRILVTSTPNQGGGTDVYLHVLLRFINLELSEVNLKDFYADVQGQQISLLELLGYGDVRFAYRQRQRDGVSLIASMRLGSERDLLQILPCTIGAHAKLGDRSFNRGTYLMRVGSSDIAAMMPCSSTSLMLLPVNFSAFAQDQNPYYRGAGRVCELSLSAIGTSKGGTICEVDWAKCRAAAGLRCSTSCADLVGTTKIIPDGLGTITGGR